MNQVPRKSCGWPPVTAPWFSSRRSIRHSAPSCGEGHATRPEFRRRIQSDQWRWSQRGAPAVVASRSRHGVITGSTRAGTEVRAVPPHRSSECIRNWRKSPNVLLDDADLSGRETERAACISKIPVSPATRRRACWFLRQNWSRGSHCQTHRRKLVVGIPVPKRPRGPVVPNAIRPVEGFIREGNRRRAPRTGGAAALRDCEGLFRQPRSSRMFVNDMTIAARDFRTVLCILPTRTRKRRCRIAKTRRTALAAYVWSQDTFRTTRGDRIRAGQVALNVRRVICKTPFGGFKMSGNGPNTANSDCGISWRSRR